MKYTSIFGDYFCPTVCNFPNIKVERNFPAIP